MRVTYVGHSGFLLEWERCYWLFDYYTGDIPKMDPDKKVFVFVSHKHGDHFNPKVFNLRREHRHIEFVLSSDIPKSQIGKVSEQAVVVEPEKPYDLRDGYGDGDAKAIRLTTLKSTDLGVAFLLEYMGKTVYHAGDLNLWVWKEETRQYNDDMTTAFNEQMNHLKDVIIDAAFVPLDPRQDEDYYLGMETLLSTAKVNRVFPMHFGKEFSVIERYKKERVANLRGTIMMDIERAGQKWEI